MRHPLRSVWLAVIGGMLGWSLRTLPAVPSQAGSTVGAVGEASLPPAHRLRPQLLTLALDLRGRPTDGGAAGHLLPSNGAESHSAPNWFIVEPDVAVADARRSAGALPYFPTGPPPVA
jgi:hypothetical protein